MEQPGSGVALEVREGGGVYIRGPDVHLMTPPGEASQPQLAVLKLSQRSEQVRPGAARRYFRNGEGVDQIEAAEDLTEARYGIEIGSPGQAVDSCGVPEQAVI